jgi:hypothetical protein
MAKKLNSNEIEHRKWERVYEDKFTISTWRFNSKISLINPYEVETKYKNDKTIPTKQKGKR